MEDYFDDMDFSFMVPNHEVDTGTIRKPKKHQVDKSLERIDDQAAIVDGGTNEIKAEENMDVTRKSSLENSNEPNINLSRDELLKLLSVFEGELQARDEVIAILKTECAQNPETRYGLTSQPMKALQRDAATLDVTSQEQVCEQTKEQLKKIIQHQKESYKRLKQLHLASQDKYQRIAVEMEEEKRKHQEYMLKSDDFVNLLESDRERLKQIIEQEKDVHERKEKDLIRKIKDSKDDNSRLKTLSLELVEERQEQLQALNEQKQLVVTLQRQSEELREKLQESEKLTATQKEHATQLENELEEQSNKFYKENEVIAAKSATEEKKNMQLEEKIATLTKQMKKLKCVDKNLRKTDDQLWRIKEKLEQDEQQEDLLEEVELLRKTVREMQEAEKIYVQAQDECKELQNALESELVHTKALGAEVERLRKSARNQTEMERCVEEANFRLDEIQQLFDAECKKANKMKIQLEEFQVKLAKMDETEETMKNTENKVKQLQQSITELKNEKEGLETKLHVEKDKCAQCLEMLEDERETVTKVSQKMLQESKKVLKIKNEMASLETKKAEELEKLRQRIETLEKSHAQCIPKEKQTQIENLNLNLKKQVAMLKSRLDRLENDCDQKEKEVALAKANADKANANLKVSTDKLKKLVALGLNEQVAIAKYEEYKEKSSSLELVNDDLKKELSVLSERLETHHKATNTNNNNILLKGVAVSNISTQTLSESRPPTPNNPHMITSARSAQSRVGSSEATTRSSSVRRVSASSRRDTSIEARSAVFQSRAANIKQKRRDSDSSQPQSPRDVKQNGTILVHLKGNQEAGKTRCQSPASMTISHDSASGEATPTFRIVRDAKTGTSQIQTSVNESKKGIHIKMSGKAKENPSKPPSPATAKSGSKATTQKVTSRVTVHPNSSSKSRTTGRIPNQASRKSSISPTRIPTLRGNNQSPTPPSHNTNITRPSRSATKSFGGR